MDAPHINPIHWWESIKKLGVNVILGYVISWVYTAVAYFALKQWIGKVRSATLAYGSSWLVWFGAAAALQTLNPSEDMKKIELDGVKGDIGSPL